MFYLKNIEWKCCFQIITCTDISSIKHVLGSKIRWISINYLIKCWSKYFILFVLISYQWKFLHFSRIWSFPLIVKNFYFQECFFNIIYIEYLNMWNLNILLINRKIKNNIVLKMKIGNNYTCKTNVMNI